MSYLVTIQPDGLQFSCHKNQTVLDAALEQGIAISYGCKNGQCGSCQGKLLSGKIEYADGMPDGLDQEDAEKGAVLFCKALAKNDLYIEIKVGRNAENVEIKTLPVRVSSLENLTGDVIKITLQLPVAEEFNFSAGQWVYFLLKDGQKRAFSIANHFTRNNQLEIHVRHAIGGVFTDFVFDQLKQGSLLRIEGPHGTFTFQEDKKPILLIAGGTGFAPIKGIMEHIIDLDFQQPIHLFWGSRAKKDLYMESLIEQWISQLGMKYTPVLSDPEPEDNWDGKIGFVHQAVLNHYPEMNNFAVYMAGPPQMISSARDAFIPAGLSFEMLYYDSFEYSSDALDKMQEKS